MSIIDNLLAILAPHDCVGCGAEGALLCVACQKKLSRPAPQCYRCRQPSPNWLTCTECLPGTSLRRVQAAAVYDSTAKSLIWRLKSNGAQAAAGIMAQLMQANYEVDSDVLIVPVPTATNRVRSRGYDQAQLVARELARRTKTPLVRCLLRQSHADQIGADREQRMSQLTDAFRVTRPLQIRGRRILLIDDVVTTGATLEAAAQIMRSAGAANIEAAVFAQPRLRKLKLRRQK